MITVKGTLCANCKHMQVCELVDDFQKVIKLADTYSGDSRIHLEVKCNRFKR